MTRRTSWIRETKPKVLRYNIEEFLDFRDIDYVRSLNIRLAPKKIFGRGGVLIRKEFYASSTLDPSTGREIFDDLIITEDHNYIRDPNGFALFRTITIKWINEDNSENTLTKTRNKTYDTESSILETDIRRQNVLSRLKVQILEMLTFFDNQDVPTAVISGQTFFSLHQNGILAFERIGNEQVLIDNIMQDTTTPWLDILIAPDATIRAFIIGRLLEITPE